MANSVPCLLARGRRVPRAADGSALTRVYVDAQRRQSGAREPASGGLRYRSGPPLRLRTRVAHACRPPARRTCPGTGPPNSVTTGDRRPATGERRPASVSTGESMAGADSRKASVDRVVWRETIVNRSMDVMQVCTEGRPTLMRARYGATTAVPQVTVLPGGGSSGGPVLCVRSRRRGDRDSGDGCGGRTKCFLPNALDGYAGGDRCCAVERKIASNDQI